ncbi:MAG TPA: NAD(P)-dependent oxidoreductase [Bosea sp. (in: a-proteobacteria)]|jgi:3-hydroxyisobutyrate dehydrogenase-like beta-hydroxyacid dehydrogenase|uniref:NAD(P)-dependent oxidoreductase n=1 Tax=Bosea sp. (in: a-proteobacteria) TaxID=1871050 RepID=UPI002E123B9D|nr:NAD(P)-dependent oxidoreductase [Bosea sp. (in: a-proteobacteria)]
MSVEPATLVTIGLIGLGNAGTAMLTALSKQFSVHVYDRDPKRLEGLDKGAGKAPIIARDVAELAGKADVIILSLPTPAASVSVASQLKPFVGPGKTILETSTVRPEDVEVIHEICGPTGARIVDAAVIGGVHKLALGRGVFLAGVAEAEAGPVGDVLRAMAEELFFLGARGNGMRAKLVANSVSHTAYILLVEAAAIAAAQNIPMDVFYRLMERESGLMRPLTHRFGERLRSHDFEGGMSTTNACKDSALVLDVARQLGVPVFAIQATHSVYELAAREGLADKDYSSIGCLWEKWLNVSFKKDA